MSKFNLAELLSDVSELDTGLNREQLEYIDVDKLKDDENNFYTVEKLDSLMGSIELLGLQQPVRVRQSGENYVIVSGHRRTEAIRRLVAEGKDAFRMIPCIVEIAAKSPELQELRLIFANSDTRVLTSAELNKQAERVEELLYKLQEQGIEFPGRMRDHVAEACKLSKTKLARLKAIKNNLAFELKFNYEQGKLNEACAYALSQLSRDDQILIYEFLSAKRHAYEGSIKSMAKFLSEARQRVCPEDICKGSCSHAEEITKKVYSSGYQGYFHCSHSGCCSTCPDIGSCRSVCPRMRDAAKIKQQEAKEKAKAEKAEKKAETDAIVCAIRDIWSRFGEARRAAGISPEKYKSEVGCYMMAKEFEELENQTAKFDRNTMLPYGGMWLDAVKKLVKAADVLGCSLDFLLGRSDVMTGHVSEPDTAAKWQTGKPAKSGLCYAKFRIGDLTLCRTACYDKDRDLFLFPGGAGSIEADFVAWYPIPEDDA